ncbi:MAG: dihydroorotate dehydrogenase electron transfer subunit [Clostridia bacterium]|nr:dihydroorotate dehydrogenase electron transfer subunit [Clostridia bacterium]MBQ2568255.1 dihydroorotate dehydrogenase electron transfer subunit [Clostridia bacterium]MBQ3327688.1 dihydroorotate dehydrogenase electron transfer subunit [Clostridia bacterium]MBQ5685131.1 dihydroorotate dehydrogenase electron transfer subunit [Clostridia bacterium]MBR0363794.1 dihydroorotate dehydrogenase electron transfer subunit [Clostridia bacterium]
MIQNTFTVCSNRALTDSVYRMVLEGPLEGAITAPGQFVNLKLPGYYLRRPISVCDWTDDTLTLIYKVVGHGTEAMAATPVGESFDLLAGLGNGFDPSLSGDTPLLVGGGVGIPPLYGLCKALLAEGKTPSVILGFNTAEEIFLQEDFETLLEGTGGSVCVTTVDGSAGTKGFVTDVMKDLDYSFFYTCGPMPMFRAIESVAATSGQYSFEERMGCGFGACMGCSIQTKNGNKRVCKDGPVLMREEILW